MSETIKCIICDGVDAHRTHLPQPLNLFFDCKNCGRFIVDSNFEYMWESNSEELFKLACVIKEYRLRGDKGVFYFFSNNRPEVPSGLIQGHIHFRKVDELLSEFPKATELIDRALLNLFRLVKHPVDNIRYRIEELVYIMFCPQDNLRTQIGFMDRMGLVQARYSSPDEVVLNITPAGLDRINNLSKIGRESRQAFVAMWFSENTDEIYEKGIKLAVEQAKYECKRIDLVEHNNKICDEIIAEIRRSRFVIADFTGNRGGVYYEAGFAMGLGLPVIWLVPEDELDKVHFDTRQYNYIVYKNPEELQKKLYSRIAATIQ